MKIFGIEIDFDMTSPQDLQAYKKAMAQVDVETAEKEAELTEIYKSEEIDDLDKTYAFLNMELQVYGNFLDNLLGDGMANKLLGKKPSLTKIYEVDEALGAAVSKSFKAVETRMNKYAPTTTKRAR